MSYSFISFSSYCKFMSHLRFVSSSFSFWVDLWENDILIWVIWVVWMNNMFWVNMRVDNFSFADKSWFRNNTFWKKKWEKITFFFETSFFDRTYSHFWLAEFQCLRKCSTLVKKHDFQHFLVFEWFANRTSARLIDSEQIAKFAVYEILIQYVN